MLVLFSEELGGSGLCPLWRTLNDTLSKAHPPHKNTGSINKKHSVTAAEVQALKALLAPDRQLYWAARNRSGGSYAPVHSSW